MPFLLAFLIRHAVRTDNMLLAIGLVVGSVLGTRWHDRRKARKKARRGSEPLV
ncbi:hypothetical protein [Kocuria sp. CNJ-770]|uniref:hypothetical protein n=1 Tax=Kocuria sp. CNJ-770 TaxID=1904964 RepID=UPI001300D739|nr:hypothetical protein [Kocuria sp. CNJ-770]